MKRSDLWAAILSLVIGLTLTGLFTGDISDTPPAESYTEQTAWWGALYPQYTLPGAVKVTDTDTDKNTDDSTNTVRIRFKYLTFLNDIGGNDE